MASPNVRPVDSMKCITASDRMFEDAPPFPPFPPSAAALPREMLISTSASRTFVIA
jgi:hypothetical protein